MHTDVLIIGAGLAGLFLADQLHRAGRACQVVEARDRLGGRILTERCDAGHFDMGPAWFWLGQPRVAALIERFDLTAFEQHYAGTLSYEDENAQIQRGQGFASMQGSYRIVGGLDRLTDSLAGALPPDMVQRAAAVTHLGYGDGRITARLAAGAHITAHTVVLAIPPRIAEAQITFDPALPQETCLAMQRVPTWMAGQAKALAVYDTPFWREAGLSGDAISRYGPMIEIHDASPRSGGPFGLFGFIGIPPQERLDEQALRPRIIAQLERLFGPKAARPNELYLKDWARDPFTATDRDQAPMTAHPTYGIHQAMLDHWDGRLLFGGTEVATHFGGYLEGALEAAEAVFLNLQS
ncbi:FAD-dependent oxidoreductase [uncultured Tateyamaria sp.]|uniref:flavin monoamine oxidase family protein n=1 Tax=uncultured Tateyamaria sp. TaxID=455651 RepID=UPI00261CAACB|nr:FAD-dependent oxidoreductase [uncultured Tateyamaria sp.]